MQYTIYDIFIIVYQNIVLYKTDRTIAQARKLQNKQIGDTWCFVLYS